VPAAVLLGFATFFLSMIPIGPPLIWGGAAAWLYSEGRPAGHFHGAVRPVRHQQHR
jgi:predicted PurR-regulated permease PerM